MDEIQTYDSILTTIKKCLGLPEDITEFDPDIIFAINTAISTLTQFGIGSDLGFSIMGPDQTWQDYVGDDKRLSMVITYIFIQTKLIFDPPSSSYVLNSMEQKAKELEWRLNMYVECKEAFPDYF